VIALLLSFIKYTQPSWQFNLQPNAEGQFPSCYATDPLLIREYVDERYLTESAKMGDAGYRLWNKGVLLKSSAEEIRQLHKLPKPVLQDEYTFIRKYWGSGWTTFALIWRLITLKNPVRNCISYFNTRNVRKINMYEEPVEYPAYETFQSSLIALTPMVSVIIPTLNRYKYMAEVLKDLEKQSYSNFEVIVVDQSDDFKEDFYNKYNLKFKVIRQKEKLLWTARNTAVRATSSKYLLFFDDDSRVGPDWIEHHLKCLDFFEADISAGVSLAAVGQKISPGYQYFRWADQFDSGNAMVKREVMQKIGMFDEEFNKQRMGDGEFGIRAYVNGLKSISNPKAFRYHLKVSTGGLREMGSWDGFRANKWFSPKPVPSVIYLYKKYFPSPLWQNALFVGILLSNIPYKRKGSSSMLLLSVFLTVVKAPLLIAQFYKSSRIAKKMSLKTDLLSFNS
jgi:glycosyltransferase involved in cell wall biosynthesis